MWLNMDFITFLFILELSFLPNGTMAMYEENLAYEMGGTYLAEIQAGVELWDILTIQGGVITSVQLKPDYSGFRPFITDYPIEVRLGIDNIYLFYRHRCIHPVMTYLPIRDITQIWEGAYNEIGFRYEARF